MFEDFSLWPERASTFSGATDDLFLFLIGVSVFFIGLILCALLLFSVRYRRRPGHRARPIEASVPLEILWTAVPLGIVTLLFVWGAKVYVRVVTPPAEGMRFHVTGKQWMWKVQHPTGQTEINSLHVPVEQDIVLTTISEDVIHSFYVPAFRTKSDVLPGRYGTLWFRPTRVGTYHLFCAEYCGTKHSEMVGQVVVMDTAGYQAWLDGRPAEKNPVETGALLFQNLRCDTCHSPGPGTVPGGAARGPDLAGRFGDEVVLSDGQTVRFDEGYVRESLLDPASRIPRGYQALMPGYRGQVREDEILALMAYLKSLGPRTDERER